MFKKCKLLVLLSTLYGCISISKIETSHLSATKMDSPAVKQNFLFYLNSNSDFQKTNDCIRTDQKTFLESAVRKYFNFQRDEIINIYIEEKVDISVAQGMANTIISVLTYTVIPVYNSIIYSIDVERVRNGKSEFWSTQVTNESLGSVLVLPFVYGKSNKSVLRNNIENAFYQVSFAKPKDVGFSSKYLEPKVSAECGSIREDFNAQQW